MYLSQTFKLRFGEISDFFNCNYVPNFFVRNMKERVVYFLYINEKLSGPYKTYWDCTETSKAFELYELIHEKKILVIESRSVSQEVLKQKMHLRTAVRDDIERNTIFYEYENKQLKGPFVLHTDISDYDKSLLSKISNNKIFVFNEKQKFNYECD